MKPSPVITAGAAALLALLLALAPAAAVAGTPIDETRPLDADATVEIENVKGRISVTAWDREEVHIGGTLGEGVKRLQVEGDRSRLHIEVEYPNSGGSWFGFGGRNGSEPTTLDIKLPRGVTLDIEAVSADVDVRGTDGPSLTVEAVSGSVDVEARAGTARIETVSGSQTLRIDTDDLGVESVSGSIRVEGAVSGRVNAEAVSGSIRVEGGALKDFSASTVSGSIGLTGQLVPGGRIGIEALSGTVNVRLPASTSARVDMSSFSGTLRSDVGEVNRSRYGPGSDLHTTIGKGEGRISLETFSGNVRLELE